MDEMAAEFAASGVQSVFVYVREAHPGEHYPHHDSFERKLAQARAFRHQFDCRRPILVDDLVGTTHQAFGKLPNMTYMLDRSHTVVFRANWTDPPTIRSAAEYLLNVQARRRSGTRLAPFYAELQGFRWVNQAGFEDGLRLAGPKALREYRDTMVQWGRGHVLTKRRAGD